jgi:chromosome segregation ATPase
MSIFANKKDLELAQEQINSLSNDLSAAQAELTAERDTVATQAQSIVDLQAQVATLTAERDASAESLTQAQSQIETLQAEVQTAEASAEQKAIALLSQNGHEAPVVIEEESTSNTKTRQEFNAMTPRQKSEFSKAGGKII